METVKKIRRAYFVQGKSIKPICRELRVSRKVVRKVLRSDATEFRYQREEHSMPRIGPWQETLDGLLASNQIKPSRERLTRSEYSKSWVSWIMKVATMRFGAMHAVGCAIVARHRLMHSFP